MCICCSQMFAGNPKKEKTRPKKRRSNGGFAITAATQRDDDIMLDGQSWNRDRNETGRVKHVVSETEVQVARGKLGNKHGKNRDRKKRNR